MSAHDRLSHTPDRNWQIVCSCGRVRKVRAARLKSAVNAAKRFGWKPFAVITNGLSYASRTIEAHCTRCTCHHGLLKGACGMCAALTGGRS